MMYFRFIWQQLKVVGMVIVAFFIFIPITYPNRRKIWAMRLLPPKDRKWYWWCGDTSETGFGTDENNYLNSTYGVYEFIKIRNYKGVWVADYPTFNTKTKFQKFIYSFRWLVFRNGAWNYIVSIVPEQIVGNDYKCIAREGWDGCTVWRDWFVHGKQFVVYPKDKPTHFRYSFTKEASWYNLHRLFAFLFSGKWYTHFNFMAGHSHNRYLVKMSSFNPEDN